MTDSRHTYVHTYLCIIVVRRLAVIIYEKNKTLRNNILIICGKIVCGSTEVNLSVYCKICTPNAQTQLTVHGGLSEWFNNTLGVRQGCHLLSPVP
jgi:hypothetical protein